MVVVVVVVVSLGVVILAVVVKMVVRTVVSIIGSEIWAISLGITVCSDIVVIGLPSSGVTIWFCWWVEWWRRVVWWTMEMSGALVMKRMWLSTGATVVGSP